MAETWNTITNLTFIILSIQGFRTVYVGAPFKLRLLPILFTIVGIGSMAFHGTLLRTAQLLDELPMLFLISQSCFIILTIQPKTSELKKYILAILGICINLSVTLIMIYYPGLIF
jgi:dihydroceramidase